MQELDSCRKLILLKPGARRVGKRKLKCLESIEEDLKKVSVRHWRRSVTRPRTVEGNFGRGLGPPRTVMPEKITRRIFQCTSHQPLCSIDRASLISEGETN